MSEAKHTPGPWSVDKDMIRAVNPITSIANLIAAVLEELEHCYYFKDKTEMEKKQKEWTAA